MDTRFLIPKSTFIKNFVWTGERISYPETDIRGDTYPMTWADADEIYTSAGDPQWGETRNGLDVEKFSGGPPDYQITKIDPMNDYIGWGGNGPKPSGMICVDGVLYLAFQNLRRMQQPPHSLTSQHGSDAQIIYATRNHSGHGVGLWAPSFVYAVSSDQWDNGSNLRLGRVPADSIMRCEAWQWVCAFTRAGEPAWHHNLDEAVPVLSLHRWLGLPEMVYVAGIKRYLLFTWWLHKDFSGDDGTDLLVLESPEPWGPFALVHAEEYWEGQAFNPYCPRLPLKWMAVDGESGWLQFSGSWSKTGQAAGYYRSHVRPFRLQMG